MLGKPLDRHTMFPLKYKVVETVRVSGDMSFKVGQGQFLHDLRHKEGGTVRNCCAWDTVVLNSTF